MRSTRGALVLAIMMIGFLTASEASAHGGGLDRHGCHTNRKTGDYHCHRGSRSSPPPKSRSVRSPRASGIVGQGSAGTIRLERAKSLASDQELTATVQRLLAALGFRPGPPDGQDDVQTRLAIRRFQDEHQIPADGKVTGQLLLRLSSEVARRLAACARP